MYGFRFEDTSEMSFIFTISAFPNHKLSLKQKRIYNIFYILNLQNRIANIVFVRPNCSFGTYYLTCSMQNLL